jgi:hypothetical protein
MKPININGMSEDEIVYWWRHKGTDKTKSHKERIYKENEKQIVIRYIHELMKRGFSKNEMVHYIREKTNFKLDTIYRWINIAYDALTADMDESIEQTRAITKERLEKILQDALENNNYNIALKTTEQLNKINGLYENKLEVKADTTISFDFNE